MHNQKCAHAKGSAECISVKAKHWECEAHPTKKMSLHATALHSNKVQPQAMNISTEVETMISLRQKITGVQMCKQIEKVAKHTTDGLRWELRNSKGDARKLCTVCENIMLTFRFVQLKWSDGFTVCLCHFVLLCLEPTFDWQVVIRWAYEND